MKVRLSVNLLNASLGMLKRVWKYHFETIPDLLAYPVSETDIKLVFSFCYDCRWIVTDDADHPSLTNRGISLVENAKFSSDALLFRSMLEDYISNIKPLWSFRIPSGRKEASAFMTKDELACFNIAGLLADEIDSSIVYWWDNLSSFIRKQKNDNKLLTGRKGEKCTIEYEWKRTHVHPVWKSIDTNIAGYDIQSVVSEKDMTSLLIETKATEEDIDLAFFHITCNEWEVAESTNNYSFYLWCFSKTKQLAIVSSEDLRKHIPVNSQEGEWESVKIPFSAFKSSFITVT